ncbi:retrovirus-related pol polyprotein from transposon TNT 1-94 [Tanacetum coccineum]|uniref:Retrovirus-related pol polyprotein from transposon TNT 1-94 n=1 Tax=Tanacetum coccineum TaxID=301880 RepID=A0ABQ5BSU5_9ASTR
MVKLNARCSAVLQNELPPKEKDPGSFIIPCSIGNTTVSNALAYLGESISFMPFSMFKRLGLGSPKPVSMAIEMADRSMQSPKRIVENVLVKINKFIFRVDFVILDIVEDTKVPIILGRPMLATPNAMIDRKISLEVGKEKVIFNANKGMTLLSVSSIEFQVPDDFGEPENPEEFLMNDDINWDLGDFLEENDLLPGIDLDSFGILSDSDNEMGFGLEDLGEGIEYFWDA